MFEPAVAPLYLLGTGQRVATIDPAESSPPSAFMLAVQVGGTQSQGGQQGFHNHGLLSYALDNDHTPPAIDGAYGFFCAADFECLRAVKLVSRRT